MQPRFEQSELSNIQCFRDSTLAFSQGQPAFSLSIKSTWKNYGGAEEQVLLYTQVNETTGEVPPPSEWIALRIEPLRAFLSAGGTDKNLFRDVLSFSKLGDEETVPGIWALLHAATLQKFTLFCQPEGLIAGFCQSDTRSFVETLGKNTFPVLPFSADLPDLFGQTGRISDTHAGVVLANWGLLIASDRLDDCLEKISDAAETFSGPTPAATPDQANHCQPGVVQRLASLRHRLAAITGRPQVLSHRPDIAWQGFNDRSTTSALFARLSTLPAQAAVIHRPVMPGSENDWKADTRLIIEPSLGPVAAGASPQEANFRLEVFRNMARPFLQTGRSEAASLSGEEFQQAARWLSTDETDRPAFAGEIALVTGAASGIGKACAASLLARGCTVIGLDINPAICSAFQHPAFLGLVCDISDESSVRDCVQQTVFQFGGLDILILNAGLFPGGCPIERMNLNEFTRVINVNLNANLVLLREAFPFLRLAPGNGRVVIIGSKNVKAPGPGAAAYSASKAAVTQLARVAALEWGAERIRVNVLHPDAVFDTALYSEEVLQTRAEHYGMTVEQYKKRNLLKAEITSHAVGEMAAEMCGSLFACVTGAQIQMDGGNDRTI